MKKHALFFFITLSLSLSAADTNDSDRRDLRIGDVFIKVREGKRVIYEWNHEKGCNEAHELDQDHSDAAIIIAAVYDLNGEKQVITAPGESINDKKRAKIIYMITKGAYEFPSINTDYYFNDPDYVEPAPALLSQTEHQEELDGRKEYVMTSGVSLHVFSIQRQAVQGPQWMVKMINSNGYIQLQSTTKFAGKR